MASNIIINLKIFLKFIKIINKQKKKKKKNYLKKFKKFLITTSKTVKKEQLAWP